MTRIKGHLASDKRIRFMFREAVVSSNLAANATLMDIAQGCEELSKQSYGRPIAIDVKWAQPPPA